MLGVAGLPAIGQKVFSTKIKLDHALYIYNIKFCIYLEINTVMLI